jgi:hypothetical protein
MHVMSARSLILRPLSALSLVVAVVGVLVFTSAPALGAGDANEAACPNEALHTGFSAQLTDCQAYELVSPPFKDNATPALAGVTEPPTVTIVPHPITGHRTAEVSGTVDTHGGEQVRVFAEYATSESGPFTYQEIATIPAGTSGVTPVSGTITGLLPGTEYFFRLDAENSANGETYSPQPYPSASTEPPASPTAAIDPNPTAGYTTAHVSGTVDPGTEEVSLYAEFRVKGSAEHWTEQFVESIASNAGPTPVSATVTGLTPDTEYEFRLDAFDPSVGEFQSATPGPSATTKAVDTPAASITAVEDVQSTTAHFSGQINPAAPEAAPTSADVEAAFSVNWHFECSPECPGLAGGTVPAGQAAQAVEADASGLEPGTTYEVTLIAENAGGSATRTLAGPETFTTVAVPPTVATPSASEASATQATLNAQVNPGGAHTVYHFEYLTQEQYEADGGFTGSDVLSTPETVLAFSDNALHKASSTVTGLTSGATYYFRAVVTNSSPGNPTVHSQTKAFIAYPGPEEREAQSCPNEQLRTENNSRALPDCRAYEQVTPSYKQSHGIYPGAGAIAPDGSSVLGVSIGAFAGSEDDPRGPGNTIGSAEYRFDRTAAGWQTTALDPSAADVLSNTGANSALLPTVDAKGVIFVLQTTNPSVTELYLREADGSLRLLGPEQDAATATTGEGPSPDEITGASADDSLVTFYPRGGGGRWPGDITARRGDGGLYAANGTSEPKLVAVSNAGPLQSNSEAELITDCGASIASSHENRGPGAISASGAFIYFTNEPHHSGSECTFGPRIQNLYLRANLEKTVSISQPELPSGEECTGACAAAEPMSAEFQGATEDGRNVFFTTAQPLLNADHDETKDLYEAEIAGEGATARVGKLTLVSGGGAGDATPGEGAGALGVLAFSRSGSRVYFAAEGALTSTPNGFGQVPQVGVPNVYSYDFDTGSTVFVATLEPQDETWTEFGGFGGSLAQATRDGRYLVFSSSADLTPDDTSGARQLFEYDAESNSLVRVSVGDRGYNSDGNTEDGDASLGASEEGRHTISIADDGAVFFTSPVALTPGATSDHENNLRNIYEYRGGRVFLIAPGVGRNEGVNSPQASATRLWGVDESGEDVFFQTTAQLTPTDTDGRPDLYDAHVDGGFPAPAVPADCAASASCQGPPSSAPGFASPASTTSTGPGNQPASSIVHPLTKKQKLAKALKACRTKHNKKKRTSCERTARHRFGAKKRPSKTTKGKK